MLLNLNPNQKSIQITGWTGRFGNNLIQLANVIWLRERFGCNITYIPPHDLIKTSELFDQNSMNQTPIKRYFFDTNDMAFITHERPTTNEYYTIFQKTLYPLLKIPTMFREMNDGMKEQMKEQMNDTLVIHLRSGDCFKEITFSPHPLYVPLPLAYFQKIIIDSYPKQFWKCVLIITEPDRINPVIDALGKWLNEKYPAIRYLVQSSDITNDIVTILSARHLVLSIGFFSKTLAWLSKQLKTLYYSDYIFQDVLIPDKNYYFYSIKNYIKAGEWKDTPCQRLQITKYSIENIELIHFKHNLFLIV